MDILAAKSTAVVFPTKIAYYKIPIISSGLIFVQKAFLVRLHSGGGLTCWEGGFIIGGSFRLKDRVRLIFGRDYPVRTVFRLLW